jgi:lysine-specific permease
MRDSTSDPEIERPIVDDADDPKIGDGPQEPDPSVPSEPGTTANTSVRRELKTRHLSMIALGGSIGTGLLLACGETIAKSGPGGALVAYCASGLMVYFLMAGLGELATSFPTSGSFSTFSARFVDPALGFASGWNDFIKHSITYVVDCLTASILMQFWLPNVPTWVWALTSFVLIFLINAFTVKSFGEIEYWMALIKVVTIVLFLIVSILRIFGAIGEPTYFSNFVWGDAPFLGGFYGMIATFVVAGFSFQGTEVVGITAAESDNPDVSIPAAIRQVFWRILIFYVFSIFAVGALIRYDNPNLLGASTKDITKSPFTIVLDQAGIPVAKDIMNGVILSAIISAANSATYASSRMLYALALAGKAPRIFTRTLNSGTPIFALCGTCALSLALYGLNLLASDVYTTLIKASSLAGFVNWFTIAISHYRFRRGLIRKGFSIKKLYYRALFFPFGPIFVMVACAFIVVCSNLAGMRDGDWKTVLISYMSVIAFVALYGLYKILKRTKIVPYETMFDDIDLHRMEDTVEGPSDVVNADPLIGEQTAIPGSEGL